MSGSDSPEQTSAGNTRDAAGAEDAANNAEAAGGSEFVWQLPDSGGGPEPDADVYLGTYSDHPYGFAIPAPVDAAANRRRRKRVLWTAAAAVAAAALVTGGVIALLPGRTGDSVVAAVKCEPADLAGCLIKAPAGAVRLTAADREDPWPQQTASTANLFAANVVDDSPGVGEDVANELTADGMRQIVHTDWNAVDGDDVDIVLLSFGTQKGAQAWNANREGEILAAYPGRAVGIKGDSAGAAHVAVKPDAGGNTHAAYSVAVGDLVLDIAYSSPKTFDAQDLQTWAATELASLRSAPPAPADPAPTAPGTEQVACTGKITSCLMPKPGGAAPWVDPTDKRWSADSTLTSSQVAHLWWDGQSDATQDSVLADFDAAGVTGIAHESWTQDDANEQADVYLIQTVTANGAAQLDADHLGEPTWDAGVDDVPYTIPGAGGVQAWYASKEVNGFTGFNYTDTIGNVDVVGWFYFSGSFDARVADGWAESQLRKVEATAETEFMGLFPLPAPALPAPVQGGCGSSTGCLMPAPAGATDTTSSSYQRTQNMTADDYAAQYELPVANEVGQWLGSDGFQGGEHRSWSMPDGAAADAVVLKYTNATQAKAAALLEYGIDSGADRVCTDSALPDSWCLAAPVDVTDVLQDEEIRVVAWKGDYEVSVSVAVSDRAEVSQAYTWAEQQFDMLPGAGSSDPEVSASSALGRSGSSRM